jgi:four helix bundle protein
MHSFHAAADTPLPTLDPQRLDCYRVAVQLAANAAKLLPRGHHDLRSQLCRAAASVALNCAEGVGRWAPAEKGRFFSIARGSAMECGAVVDLARSLGLAPAARCKETQWLVVRVVQMLTKLEAACRSRRSG